MAVVSRALIKGRRAAKRARNQREEEKRREAIKQVVVQFPEAWIDLQQNLEIVRSADLTKPENSFLVVERIETGRIIETIEQGKPVKNVNPAILDQFMWIDTEIMRFTAYPITEKFVGAGMYVRFLVWSKNDFPASALMHIYAEINENTMCPEISLAQFNSEPNALLIVDVFISGEPKENEQNFFLTVFSYFENENSREAVIEMRTRANFDKDTMLFENYTDIKESKYLNTVEQKHIHPVAVKTIVKKQILGQDFSIKAGRNNIIKWGAAVLLLGALLPIIGLTGDLGFFFWFILVLYVFFILFFGTGILGGIAEIKLVKKSRELLLIDEKSSDTRIFEPLDRTWLIDFCSISEHWSFNAEMEDITYAFSIHNKST